MTNGKVDKYILKIMSDPKSVPHWDQAKFDNLKRSAEAMRQVRKKIKKAKREAHKRQQLEEEGYNQEEE